MQNANFSKEILYHFQCLFCKKWWTIGDAHINSSQVWYCPWCGKKQQLDPNILKEDALKDLA